MLKPYMAFAVELSGVALAKYDLAANNTDDAKSEARLLLVYHDIIEVWHEDRLVARLHRVNG
jgi:hypothetical protein